MFSPKSLVFKYLSFSSKALCKQVALCLVITILLFPYHRAEEECLKSKVMCYECESLKDRRCNDPFNSTNQVMKLCNGCCVKVVRGHDKPTRNIWRTCTTRLKINLFMVDHVCMEESGGQGHMCFCETDACNGVSSLHQPGTFLAPVGSLIAHMLASHSIPLPLAAQSMLLALSLPFILLSISLIL